MLFCRREVVWLLGFAVRTTKYCCSFIFFPIQHQLSSSEPQSFYWICGVVSIFSVGQTILCALRHASRSPLSCHDVRSIEWWREVSVCQRWPSTRFVKNSQGQKINRLSKIASYFDSRFIFCPCEFLKTGKWAFSEVIRNHIWEKRQILVFKNSNPLS